MKKSRSDFEKSESVGLHEFADPIFWFPLIAAIRYSINCLGYSGLTHGPCILDQFEASQPNSRCSVGSQGIRSI